MGTGSLNNLIANALEIVAANLRSGNSNISAVEANEISETIWNLTNQNRELSTDETIRELNVSRNYFYDHVKPRLKGTKRPGQKTILYSVKEINKFKDLIKNSVIQ